MEVRVAATIKVFTVLDFFLIFGGKMITNVKYTRPMTIDNLHMEVYLTQKYDGTQVISLIFQ